MGERIRFPVSSRVAVVSLLAPLLTAAIFTGTLFGGQGQQSRTGRANQSGVVQASARTQTLDPPVARVNGQTITFRQLAEECIARNGPEVLESIISRLLVLQECNKRGIRVSAEEVDAEIGRTAARLNMSRERFLALLKKERGITPERYAEDIVLPTLALKKLAKPYVKVSEEDIERAFEAQYGEKVQCRWIMFDDQRTAMRVWNMLRDSSKNDDGTVELAEFEHQVMRWSTDVSTRSIGGKIHPISRHMADPFKQIEKAAFSLKKDGEISKVIQFGSSYVILYREKLLPAANVKLEEVRDQLQAQVYQAKLMAEVGRIFKEIKQKATIENYLTGDVHMPQNAASIQVTGGTQPSGRTKGGSTRTIRR